MDGTLIIALSVWEIFSGFFYDNTFLKMSNLTASPQRYSLMSFFKKVSTMFNSEVYLKRSKSNLSKIPLFEQLKNQLLLCITLKFFDT